MHIIEILKQKIEKLKDDCENGKSRWVDKIENAHPDAQHEMEGYMWALNDISLELSNYDTRIDNFNEDDKKLLLYLENCAVKQSGIINFDCLNKDEIEKITEWNNINFIHSGTITSKDGGGYWVCLSDVEFFFVYIFRYEKASNEWNNRNFRMTTEMYDYYG